MKLFDLYCEMRKHHVNYEIWGAKKMCNVIWSRTVVVSCRDLCPEVHSCSKCWFANLSARVCVRVVRVRFTDYHDARGTTHDARRTGHEAHTHHAAVHIRTKAPTTHNPLPDNRHPQHKPNIAQFITLVLSMMVRSQGLSSKYLVPGVLT